VKKTLLVIRLLVETTFGLTCMATLLLLPGIWKGTFPLLFIIGFLGMPRRYDASASTEFQRVNVITFGSLLTVAIILLIGALCFKDAYKIMRKLRANEQES
jgi:heme/copper-type cytochrome/quinol oxidase subunit 1